MNPLRYWFVPCQSGDFRLSALTSNVCRLTVEDPTIEDYAKLQPFLATMIELGWVNGAKAIVKPKGLTTIDIRIGIDIAGPLLVNAIHAKANTWTGVRFENGKVHVNDGADLSPPPPEEKPPEDPPKETPNSTALVPAAPNPPVPVAAATVEVPKRGCPAPTACARRASEVLRTFSSPSQWDSWQRLGRMSVIGNVSGARYTLFHRDEASARGLRHVLLAPSEVSGRRRWFPASREVCVWDEARPPEEEALAIKFAVEHREGWLMEFPGLPE